MKPGEAMLNPPAEGREGAAAAPGENGTSEDRRPMPFPAEDRTERASRKPDADRGTAGGGGEAHLRRVAFVVRLAVGLLILLAALALAAALVSNRQRALPAPPEEVARQVRAVEAVPQPAESVVRRWEGFGTARAKVQADVAAEVPGRVVARPAGIDPGIAVQAGDVLVRIEESDFRERMQSAQHAAAVLTAQLEGLEVEGQLLREQIEQAREQARLIQWEIERMEQARAGAAATELELVRLRTQLSRQESERLRIQQQLDAIPTRRAALEAELAARRNDASVAERQLGRTTVVSPIDGVLQAIDANVGEMMQVGQRIARVVDLQRIEIPLRIPASAQGEVRIGDVATVRASSAGVGNGLGRRWEARIVRLAPEADPQTRTTTVFLEVEQDVRYAAGAGSAEFGAGAGNRGADWSHLLMPGRFVSAEVAARAGNGEMLVIVPRHAVADDRVWVAVEDAQGRTVAQPRQVRVLYSIEGEFAQLEGDETQWAVIGAGVHPGERVIITNLDELVPGGRVEVVAGRE
jgi:multidrug efflux pump subunit AcrA (membrane-fusion protein)